MAAAVCTNKTEHNYTFKNTSIAAITFTFRCMILLKTKWYAFVWMKDLTFPFENTSCWFHNKIKMPTHLVSLVMMMIRLDGRLL